MSAEYTRDHCKIAVAKILQTIGWHSINTTPLEVLTDILSNYIKEIAKTSNDYANEFGQTEPNLDHVGLAFEEMGVNLPELEEYVTYVNFVPPAHPVPKYPLLKESNLNFLKPGSKEVVTRPVHINEHLPPMYPLLEEQNEPLNETSLDKKEITDNEFDQFKKPAEVGSQEFKRIKREEESGRPTREISSVMMTTSGFLSPAREGRLPETKAPAPPPEPPKPPSPIPVPELVPVIKKKPEKKKEKIPKELFKPDLPPEKVPKKANNMKDVLSIKRAKAMAANAANMMSPVMSGIQPLPTHFMSQAFAGDIKMPPLMPHKVQPAKTNFNKALAAAKAKTEKLNTTITPIHVKAEPKYQPIDKLVTEPDKKKINILRKISNVKHEKPKTNPAHQLMQQAHDIVSKISLSSDITIEPINPMSMHHSHMKMEQTSYFDHGSPPGTPPTPRTPEIITQMQCPPFKEKRKRKEKPDKPRVKKPRKQIPMPQPHFLDSDFLDMSMGMGRPKTPDAHLVMRKTPQFPPMPANPGLPFVPFFAGPGLIPTMANSMLFAPPLPEFSKNPYAFPMMAPKPEPVQKVSPKAKPPKEEPKEVIKTEVLEVGPLPIPIPPAKVSPIPKPPPVVPVIEEAPIKIEDDEEVPSEVKKLKEHKKDKKDKLKKKNKKEKIKDKTEKKKLKEAKKEKLKIKKEKKEKKKLPKEEVVVPAEAPAAIPKILLKVNSPSPRPETPEALKKLNIKPIIQKEDHSPERKPLPEPQRESSPGLAQISALVIGPPKTKLASPVAAPSPGPEKAEKPAESSPTTPSRPPGRPRIHPVKPKPLPKPKKIEQPPFVKVDAEGNEVWICPACGQQDDGGPMIGCDGCDAWYHWVCVGIQVPPDENENWYCKPCLAKKNEDLQDRKKKRKKKDKGH